MTGKVTDPAATEVRAWTEEVLRGLTSPFRRLPDFLILGAQRAGTTSLYTYLLQHPQVAGARKKELHFFDREFGRGVVWYRSCFPLSPALAARAGRLGAPVITGEATPAYLFHPRAADRIAELLPEAQLIVLLRNPVERAISHYHHEVRAGVETLPLDEALAREPERLAGEAKRIMRDAGYTGYAHQHFSYRSRGIYVPQIRVYRERFPREQMLVLQSETFFRDVQAGFAQVTAFLKLEQFILRDVRPRNKGRYRAADPRIVRELHDFFAPHNEALYAELGKRYDW